MFPSSSEPLDVAEDRAEYVYLRMHFENPRLSRLRSSFPRSELSSSHSMFGTLTAGGLSGVQEHEYRPDNPQETFGSPEENSGQSAGSLVDDISCVTDLFHMLGFGQALIENGSETEMYVRNSR